MKCEKLQEFLPDMLLGSVHVPADVRLHLEDCSKCQNDWKELQATMRMLDAWEAPEPTPYFDTRMAVRLREEKNAEPAGWLDRMRSRLLFDSTLHLRPAMATAFALLLVVGAGSYEGFVSLNKTTPPQRSVSATVKDLELFDSNAKTLQQLAAFDDSDASGAQVNGRSLSN